MSGRIKGFFAAVLALLVLSESTWGLVTLDSSYNVEIYATYSCSEAQYAPRGITFDASGNLYLSQWGSYPNQGMIYRVSPDTSTTKWVDTSGSPRRMVWAGGTAYGDYLYVTDGTSPGDILRINSSGTVSTFVTVGNGPHSLALDEGSAYGGKLYVGTRSPDQIYSVSETGSVQLFSSFPGAVSGGHVDLTFDPGSQYGGLMYAALEQPGGGVGGVFAIDTSGNATKLTQDEIVSAWNVEIDSYGMFGDQLFLSGIYGFSQQYYSIWSANQSGQVSEFAVGTYGEMHLRIFTFGPDGAMYVPEYSSVDNQVIISRVTRIPTPGTLCLCSIGIGVVGWLRRRRTI